MNDRNKVIKLVVIIVVVCFIIILAAAIALRVVNGKINKSTTSTSQVNNEDESSSKESEFTVEYSSEYYITKNDNGEIVCQSERNIPTVSNSTYAGSAKRIENTLKSTMNDLWYNDLKRYSEEAKNVGTAENPVGVKYLANLEYQTNDFVTFSIKIDGDFGTSAMSLYELYTFDVKTGESLTVRNVTNNLDELNDSIIKLTKKAVNKRKIKIKTSEGEAEENIITTNMAKQGNFGILADGIHINYQRYEISNDSDQVIEVILEKGKSNSLLSEKYKIR